MDQTKPLKYTGARLQDYQETVVALRLRGEARLEIIRELNKRERKARQQKKKRDEARRLKEEQEAKERSERIAREFAERVQKEKEKREARNAKRRQQRKEAKERAEKERRQKAIAFDKLEDWVNRFVADRERPFRLRLQSGNSRTVRVFNFNSIYHFQNWLEAINRQAVINESENYKVITEIMNDEDVFAFVIPELLPVDGGCNYHKKEEITKETPYFTFNLYNPIGGHNNCGFRVLEHILNCKLDYSSLRKLYNIDYDKGITPEIIQDIYKNHKNKNKFLIFIDDEFNDELKKDFHYILIADNHYYYIKSWEYKGFCDKKTKRGFLYWDIETRPTEEYVMVGERKSYILKDTILCAYYQQYKSTEWKKLLFVTNPVKSSCRQFLDWLSVQANEGHFYHAVAHNGSRFDLYFLLSDLTEQEQLLTETQLRGYSIIGMQYKSHLFKDSCCFLTASLDDLCKAFKVKQAKLTEFMYQGKTLTNKNICFYKPELSFWKFMELQHKESEFWNLYTEYCLYDCIGLMSVWSSFRDQINGLTDIMFQYKPELKAKVELMTTNTIGSLSKKILENTCLEKDKKTGKFKNTKAYSRYADFSSKWIGAVSKEGKDYIKKVVDDEKIKFINSFKRGGISHSNQPGKHTHELISYDIASQYPASMIHMLIPAGESEWVTSYNKFKHGYYELKNLVFDTDYKFKPVASINEKSVLVWDNNSIEHIKLDSFMLKYLQENYGLKSFDVVKGLVSNGYIKGEELFGDYVNTLYAEKKKQDEYKTTGNELYNPALRECIKLFLNSLSGKLVEDPSRYFKLSYTMDSSKLQMNGINARKETSEDKNNIWVSAGCMVYSYSKRLLFEYVRCLPKDSDDVIHIETDSIYFNKKNNAQFIENIKNYKQPKLGYYPVTIGANLGNVKVEKDTDEVSYFLGKKFYCIGDLYKIKGIPLKTIDEYGNDVKLVDTQLYDDIYNGKTIVKEFCTMKKALFDETTYISSHRMTRTIRGNMKYNLYE